MRSTFLFQPSRIPSVSIGWSRTLVHEPLSLGQFDCHDCTLAIIHLASVPQKVKLPQIAMQVFPAYAVINPHDAALQESEGTFRRIRVDVAANVFMCAVGYAVVTASILRTDALV